MGKRQSFNLNQNGFLDDSNKDVKFKPRKEENTPYESDTDDNTKIKAKNKYESAVGLFEVVSF